MSDVTKFETGSRYCDTVAATLKDRYDVILFPVHVKPTIPLSMHRMWFSVGSSPSLRDVVKRKFLTLNLRGYMSPRVIRLWGVQGDYVVDTNIIQPTFGPGPLVHRSELSVHSFLRHNIYL